METVKSKQMKEFEEFAEELKKRQEEINKIRNERDRQNELYDRELGIREMKLKEAQSALDFFNCGTLENAMPKYFKMKERNRNAIAEAYKTRKIIPKDGSFKLLANGIFCAHDDISDDSRVQFTTKAVVVLGYNLEDALNHISSHYEEITEEEYNDLKKIACEAIMKS